VDRAAKKEFDVFEEKLELEEQLEEEAEEAKSSSNK
jgi:hypothetical protein